MKAESLRQRLQEAEDGLVGVRRELIEAHRELQELAQDRDRQRKETLDLRRLLGDETREKESIQSSNQELRALIKRAESDNSRYTSPLWSCVSTIISSSHCSFLSDCYPPLTSLRRAVEEREQKVAVLEECRSSVDQEASTLRSSMRELEKCRLQARRELQELRRQVTDRPVSVFPSDLSPAKNSGDVWAVSSR